MIGWRRHNLCQFLGFGLKVSIKRLLLESQTILFMQILDRTKLPKLVLFGVKEAV